MVQEAKLSEWDEHRLWYYTWDGEDTGVGDRFIHRPVYLRKPSKKSTASCQPITAADYRALRGGLICAGAEIQREGATCEWDRA